MTAPERAVVDFDHHSERYAVDGVSIEREMRTQCPVAWSPHYGGFWVVSTHEDVSTCLRDFETFSQTRPLTLTATPKAG